MSGLNWWLFIVAVAAVTAVAELAFRSRAQGSDTGAHWAWTIAKTVSIAGGLLFIYSMAHAVDPALAPFFSSAGWMLIAGGMWALFVALSFLLVRDPSEGNRDRRGPPAEKEPMLAPVSVVRGYSEQGRWLAGSIRFTGSRLWLAGFTLLLLPALYAGFGPATATHRTGVWAWLVTIAASLVAASLSRASAGTAQAAPKLMRPTVADAARPNLERWPDSMAQAGIALQPLCAIPASQPAHVPESARLWADRLRAAGLDGVSPEWIEVLQKLTGLESAGARSPRSYLVFAPPASGGEETLAMAAIELARRSGEITLAVPSGDPAEFAARLRRYSLSLSGGTVDARAVDASSDEFLSAQIWVAGADALSDYLLSYLKDEAKRTPAGSPLIRKIGLVAWWDVHAYSGVRAAHVWAISRRLERLLEAEGRPGVRAFAVAPAGLQANAQSTAFLEHLLPYAFSKDNEARIPLRVAKPTSVWITNSELTRAAAASAQSGWPTRVEDLMAPREPESAAALHAVLSGDKPLDTRFAPSSAEAAARLFPVRDADVLSIPERIACGARSLTDLSQHAALLAPDNPYAEFLIEEFGRTGELPYSRYLLRAEGHPDIVERHLKRALHEAPDTLIGLRDRFLWQDSILEKTLRSIGEANPGHLHREAVRFLDSRRRLQRDFRYSNLQPESGLSLPLDSVGTELVEVRDPAQKEGLQRRVDPDRAAIAAYPRCVFHRKGRRYRIEEWTDARIKEWREGKREVFLKCDPCDTDERTWRGRTFRLSEMRARTSEMLLRGGVRRFSVSARYREEVVKVLERRAGKPDARSVRLSEPVFTAFMTEALVLAVDAATPKAALDSLAMALRHVVPVHLAIEEDEMEVIALHGAKIDGAGTISGIALVDLMPGGAGLVVAVEEDNTLLETLFERTQAWLFHATGRGLNAEKLFGPSPLAQATGGAPGLDLEPALQLLTRASAARARS